MQGCPCELPYHRARQASLALQQSMWDHHLQELLKLWFYWRVTRASHRSREEEVAHGKFKV